MLNTLLRKLNIIIILICTLFYFGTYAQDVERKYDEIKKRLNDKPIKWNGLLTADGSAYHSYGITGRAVPYLGRLSAILNLDIYGIHVGGSANLSSGGTVFNTVLPAYTFIGISPKYKWATLHLGTRKISLGKYTFNNHSFNGIGFELKPGNWRFASFYGNLRRARPEDFLSIQRLEPIFRRTGFGMKGGYDNGKDAFLVSLFKAWDNPNSIPVPDSSFQIYPSENVIISLETVKAISSKINLKAEYAQSGFTENRSINTVRQTSFLRNYAGLLETNESTRWNQAFDIGLHLTLKKATLSVQYERIDPGFRTMGALFFLNDLENVHMGLKIRLWKNKLQLSGKAGLQKNNLNGTQVNKYKRFVGSGMLNYHATERLSFFGSASSFNNVVFRSSIQDVNSPLTVTELILNNEDYNLGASYLVQKSQRLQGNLQLNFNYSKGLSIENDIIQSDANTQASNLIAYYTLLFVPEKWGLTIMGGRQTISFGFTKNQNVIAGIGVNKTLFRDLISVGINSSISFNKQWMDESLNASGELINMGISVSYKINESMQLIFNSMFLSNNTIDIQNIQRRFGELRSSLVFTYRFKS
jgi:hypothetical protein